LQAALHRLLAPRTAAGAGAVLFGLWHVASTFSRVRANEPDAGGRERAVAVLAGCAATGVAGVLFGWLRRRSDSLLAPAVVHLAANDLGLLAAAAAHRLPAGGT
jgi:membrane protease YdiL (CAAX protease family)